MRHSYRQLEVFVSVARLGSVSRAAESLALSQSATSTALSDFERQFDARLFDRRGKTLHLNALGQQVLPRAVEILDRGDELEALMRGAAGFGHFAIGATLTIGNYLATLIVADFLQRHPESRVQLQVRNTATIIQQLVSMELDIGLIEGACRHPELVVQPWVSDELVVFAAPGHPLACRGMVGLDELTAEAWILREPGSGTRETFEQAMRHCQVPLQVRLELEHTEAIKRAVESGLGIGCISRLALRDAFRRGSLVPLECPHLDLGRQFHFAWHRDKYHTASMREFLGLCRALTAGVRRSDEIPLPLVP